MDRYLLMHKYAEEVLRVIYTRTKHKPNDLKKHVIYIMWRALNERK
jgi:hypothetical protein